MYLCMTFMVSYIAGLQVLQEGVSTLLQTKVIGH